MNDGPLYTGRDVGWYTDGTLGIGHVRDRLALLVDHTANAIIHPGGRDTGFEIVDELRGAPTDDLTEEDDAIQYLNDHTAEGFVWTLLDGDLVLIPDRKASLIKSRLPFAPSTWGRLG